MSAGDETARHADRLRGERALQAAGIGHASWWNENNVLVFGVATRDKAKARQLLRAAGVLALVSDKEV